MKSKKETGRCCVALKDEKAVTTVVSILARSLQTLFNSLKLARSPHILKRNARPLVPLQVHKHRRALSLAARSKEGIKPFSIYSIKRHKLAQSMSQASHLNLSLDCPPVVLTEQVTPRSS